MARSHGRDFITYDYTVAEEGQVPTKGGIGNLGAARAMVVGAGTGIVAVIGRRRKRAEAVTKLRPMMWAAHCSGI
jgi:hypothetical protein